MTALFLPPKFAYQSIPDPELFLHFSSLEASSGRPDRTSSSKDVLPRLNSPTQNLSGHKMVQKTHKHRLTRRIFLSLFYLFKYKYRIIARYWTLDQKHAFASLAMFDIQYFITEWLDTRAISYRGMKLVLKQGMKVGTISVNRKWDKLVTYWFCITVLVPT